jgi:hypothetical protein
MYDLEVPCRPRRRRGGHRGGCGVVRERPHLDLRSDHAKDLARSAGAPFPGKFGKKRHGGPAINSFGDVVFFATPKGGPRRLYLYPNVGAPSIVAEQGGAAPGGGTFSQFRQPSINDAGDIGFFGDLVSGEGVFIDPAAGAMFAVALSGGAAPSGGVYETFDGVSRINAAATSPSSPRERRSERHLRLRRRHDDDVGGGARRRRRARRPRDLLVRRSPRSGSARPPPPSKSSPSSRAPTRSKPADRRVSHDGLGIARVALAGDPTPVGGTTYSGFLGDPDLNATDQVLFRATIDGTSSGRESFSSIPSARPRSRSRARATRRRSAARSARSPSRA